MDPPRSPGPVCRVSRCHAILSSPGQVPGKGGKLWLLQVELLALWLADCSVSTLKTTAAAVPPGDAVGAVHLGFVAVSSHLSCGVSWPREQLCSWCSGTRPMHWPLPHSSSSQCVLSFGGPAILAFSPTLSSVLGLAELLISAPFTLGHRHLGSCGPAAGFGAGSVTYSWQGLKKCQLYPGGMGSEELGIPGV